MSRTYKDKKLRYLNTAEFKLDHKEDIGLKTRYRNFKKSGPPVEYEQCPECGGYTDYQNGYLCCEECNYSEVIYLSQAHLFRGCA